jgi:septal ring factor EnvC (AmiA/AmiB activator)
VAVQKSMLEEKQSQQQTLVYEQRAQQASWSRRATSVKTLASLESSIQQGQQQLSEMRANESRLRGRIAQAAAAAKARRSRSPRSAGCARSSAGCLA